MLREPSLGPIVLDELTYPLRYGWLELATVLADPDARPPMQHVVITGRGASDALCDVADTVTELSDVKHAFRAGVRAQRGIDL
jgi:cob(I)alamin adenosyltransferase